MSIFHLPPTAQKMIIKINIFKKSQWDLLCYYSSWRRRKEKNKELLSRHCWMMTGRGAVTTGFLVLPSNLLKSHHLLLCLNLVMTRLWSRSRVLIMPLFKSFTICLPLFSMRLHPSPEVQMVLTWKWIPAKNLVAVLDLLIALQGWQLFCHGLVLKVQLGCNQWCLGLLALPWVIDCVLVDVA